MTVVGTTGAATSILAAQQSAPTTSAGTTGMDKDTFLKLLVAQMKYQDPQSPTDSSAFITQTASYSQVEALQKLNDQNTALLSMQRATSAGALVGRTVTYNGADGSPVTGSVSSVTIATDDAEAQATVNGTRVPVIRLTSISA